MASTRTDATTRGAAGPTQAETPTTALRTVVRRGARIQIAACSAAANTFTQWARSTDRLAQAMGDELLRRVDGETGSAELAARVVTASGTHLRELTELPRLAADHFDTRLARVPNGD
jgi:hypothetical protein